MSRRKGSREELQVRDVLKVIDPEAQRVPLSGAGGGKFAGDVTFDAGPEGSPDHWVIECKIRANGFSQLYGWIGANDILTVRRNNDERLWVVRENTMVALLQALKGIDNDSENDAT
jgi:hypothetical protein